MAFFKVVCIPLKGTVQNVVNTEKLSVQAKHQLKEISAVRVKAGDRKLEKDIIDSGWTAAKKRVRESLSSQLKLATPGSPMLREASVHH